MADNANNPLSFLFGSGNNQSKEVTTEVIKIRGSTIILEDGIINIKNISMVGIVSLAVSFPWISPVLLFFGYMIMMGRTSLLVSVFGLLLLAWGAYLIYYYFNKLSSRGLLIVVNAGLNASILLKNNNEDLNFLRQIVITLYNIINNQAEENLDINLEKRTIQQIHITGVSNSIISTASITGSVTNSVI